MKIVVATFLLSLSVAESMAQKFVFSGSLGCTIADPKRSIVNRVGDPNWQFSSTVIDTYSPFAYAIGLDAAFIRKKLTISSGVHYLLTNHIARFNDFDDPLFSQQILVAQGIYIIRNIEIPLLVSYPIWEPKYFSISGCLGTSFNFNSVDIGYFAPVFKSDPRPRVGLAGSGFITPDEESFFSLGNIVGMSIRAKTFLKRMSIGCYYNLLWLKGANGGIGISTYNENTNVRYDYYVSYQIRPSYFVFYVKYDFLGFALKE